MTMFRHVLGFSTLATLIAIAAGTNPTQRIAGQPSTVVVTNYHGWTNALLLNNGVVEAVIVPAAGRVLQFRFAGASNGPFWENRLLDGRTATATNWNTEGSFGGDKAWPSPQSDWGWPPPPGFDGSPSAGSYTNGVVTLTTPVDAAYQIRTTRFIALAPGQPLMRIRTVFERVAATERTNQAVGIWIVTQLQDPVRCVVPVPSPSVFPSGYAQLGKGMPAGFQHTNGFISFVRDRTAARKLGFDSDSLVWIGTNLTLRIDAPRVAGFPKTAYPDDGSSTEIYTNPGAPYIEHEFLGPLTKLPVGGRMEFLTTYILFNRVEANPETEARRVLSWRE